MKALTEAEREELILAIAGAFLNERDKECVKRAILHNVALDVKTRCGARAVEAFFAARDDSSEAREARAPAPKIDTPGDIAQAIIQTFAFADTAEGFEYWNSVVRRLTVMQAKLDLESPVSIRGFAVYGADEDVILGFPNEEETQAYLTPQQARDLGKALIQKADGVAAFTPKIVPAAPRASACDGRDGSSQELPNAVRMADRERV